MSEKATQSLLAGTIVLIKSVYKNTAKREKKQLACLLMLGRITDLNEPLLVRSSEQGPFNICYWSAVNTISLISYFLEVSKWWC